jgi:hypothetical protein
MSNQGSRFGIGKDETFFFPPFINMSRFHDLSEEKIGANFEEKKNNLSPLPIFRAIFLSLSFYCSLHQPHINLLARPPTAAPPRQVIFHSLSFFHPQPTVESLHLKG